MKARPEPEWDELEARSSSKELWALPKWDGKPEFGPWKLADGRDIDELIATGDVDQLGFPIWFEPYQSYRRAGDLIWSSSWEKLASERFIDVLTSINATDFEDLRGEPQIEEGPSHLRLRRVGREVEQRRHRRPQPVPAVDVLVPR